MVSSVCHSMPGLVSLTGSRSDTSHVCCMHFSLTLLWAFVPTKVFQGFYLPVEMLFSGCESLTAHLPGLLAVGQGWPASTTAGSYEVLNKSHIFVGVKGKDFCSVRASVSLGLTQLFYLLEHSSFSLARRPLSFCLCSWFSWASWVVVQLWCLEYQ